MIEARGLTKRYGDKLAVDNISFTVEPGAVTGFLGPNGAGKSTTMRMIMGLDKPTAGTVTVAGKKYKDLNAPLCSVGALLDAKGLHGSRSARAHLTQLAVSNGIPTSRVDKVLDITGLTQVAKKRVKGFSLGMGQRLGMAAALLGDPDILIFDEPINGLDPEGVIWVRQTCRALAAEGRTVFISSHLMSEMSQTADRLIVIGRGRILTTGPVSEIIASATTDTVRVASPQATDLAALLASQGITVATPEPGVLTLTEAPAARIGELAAAHGITLHELTTIKASLEDAYLELTGGATEYSTAPAQANRPSTRGAHRA
ncbi:ATP-binding cassette domain-containing protein [Actinomyces gaoshouyii]|uniref:Multidrug ABC transporter ATP-binding protein n=1 Tax=Actinomyces gaoshouyii TaxID=1960083 RepID=A0A8H9HA75_9ACTO|nr:ATP-binding cassette domain-containing protein [Actinomyces gaoshouyii]ARD41170.1 multidrug ABC transporter ATP-binding protein [Actinomyces gaoshouyii]GGO99673.1 multidrug ABC transporter ATP-binding protein [Actinomyces gaoshouyii]